MFVLVYQFCGLDDHCGLRTGKNGVMMNASKACLECDHSWPAGITVLTQ
jgi:hypothetical protein